MYDSRVGQRTVVVTGATSGLGRDTAGLLATVPGLTVVVAARDPSRGAEVARELGDDAIALALDLADLRSVRAFGCAVATAGLPPLHAIVANAGVQYTDRRHTSADGYEATFATNHLGHFALLRQLLPVLAPGGRIVIVASATHKRQRLRNFGFPPPSWDDPRALARPGEGSGQVAYATSKLANVMTTLELRRRVGDLRPGTTIAVHGFDPGLMPDTALARGYPAPVRRLYAALAPALARLPGASTAEASAAQLARMVTDPSFEGPGGRDVEIDRDGQPSAQARDPRLARTLWEASDELTAG